MRECFVIMPIGSGEAYQAYLNRYEHIIQPAVEGLEVDGQRVFRCVRADFVTKSGSITRDLLSRLYRSDAVIADLTDLNPNVFYELGVRHALRSGTILVALKGTRPPFDVGDLRVVPYEDRVGGEREAIPQIREMLKSLLPQDRPQDSPVLDAIPELAQLGAVREHEARVIALLQERDLLKAQLEISEKATLATQALIESLRVAIEGLSKRLPESQIQDAKAEFAATEAEKQRAPSGQVGFPSLKGVTLDSHKVFVLMPFSRDFDPVFEEITEAVTRSGMFCFRADTISNPGTIIDQIFESIAGSGLIVADLTGRNQNVMYELGLATAMRKPTVLLSQGMQDVPFDLQGQRVLIYDSSPGGMRELGRQLRNVFRQHSR